MQHRPHQSNRGGCLRAGQVAQPLPAELDQGLRVYEHLVRHQLPLHLVLPGDWAIANQTARVGPDQIHQDVDPGIHPDLARDIPIVPLRRHEVLHPDLVPDQVNAHPVRQVLEADPELETADRGVLGQQDAPLEARGDVHIGAQLPLVHRVPCRVPDVLPGSDPAHQRSDDPLPSFFVAQVDPPSLEPPIQDTNRQPSHECKRRPVDMAKVGGGHNTNLPG